MPSGYLQIILHAHLPFVKHPEHERFLEEHWLYEALTWSYIPLVDLLERLFEENKYFKLTLSVSPPLIEMLADKLLQDRYIDYLDRLIRLSENEIKRTSYDNRLSSLARHNNEKLLNIKYVYETIYKKDIISRIESLSGSGCVELITTSATHAYLPNLMSLPDSVVTQINIGLKSFENRFGFRPSGIWLPECGYYEGLDKILKNSSIKYTFLEHHGILNSAPSPKYGIYRPVRSPSGVVMFGRDGVASGEVWSRHLGYPGDFDYRDFYRDIGFDLDCAQLEPFMHPDGIRTFTGIKYHRITGETDAKDVYSLKNAQKKARLHAENYIQKRTVQIMTLKDGLGIKPIITVAFDAELFGHWWAEGIEWLECLIRTLATQDMIEMTAPSAHLNSNDMFEDVEPTFSSWGRGGYGSTWTSEKNHKAIIDIHKSGLKMSELKKRFSRTRSKLIARAINQALRELLLMQSSDWPFMTENTTSPDYAEARLSEHIENFRKLFGMIMEGSIDKGFLYRLEEKNGLFGFLDFRDYGRSRS